MINSFEKPSVIRSHPPPLALRPVDEPFSANSFLQHIDYCSGGNLDPTPIGPKEGLKVVTKVTIQQDRSLLAFLRPLLKRATMDMNESNPSKRQRAGGETALSGSCSSESASTTTTTTSIEKPLACEGDAGEEPASDHDSECPTGHRFSDHQSEQWHDKFQDLQLFQKKYRHCDVPYTWEENQPLAQWVKRQRYQYKLEKMDKHSTMTDKRFEALSDLGFCWDYHGAVWGKRLNELREYKKAYGHCNVPAGNCSSGNQHRQLAVWVKRQRRQFKLFYMGDKKSNMTAARMAKFESLEFIWDPRNRKA
jgi:hypothetical protein